MSQPAYSSETSRVNPNPKRIAAVAAAATKGGGARKATNSATSTLLRQPAQVLSDPRLPGIEITLELITPETAEFYLSKLPNSQSAIQQRSLSTKSVDRYSEDMASEQWLFIADVIRFNTIGELVDGQHRLRSIIQAGTSEFQLVARGLEPESFAVFDTGRARSFTDALRSLGVSNVSMAAGTTRRVFHWRRGNYGVANVARVPNPQFLGVPASPGKLLETFHEMRQEIQQAGRRGGALKAQFATKTAAPAVVAFIYLLFSRLDLDRCEAFFHELQVGPAQVGPEYPIAVLRDRLMRQVKAGEQASPDWVWIHFFITTWNKWYEAKSMGPLKTPPRSTIQYVAKPIDPNAATRPEGWEPLGGVTA